MTKRERIEDLGRISVLSDDLSNHEVFEIYTGRRKDIHEYWASLDSEQKDDFLHNMAYGLNDVHEKLLKIWEISTGEDPDHA